MESVSQEMISLSDEDLSMIQDDLESLLVRLPKDEIKMVLDCYTELREARLIYGGSFDDGEFSFILSDVGVDTKTSQRFKEHLAEALIDHPEIVDKLRKQTE